MVNKFLYPRGGAETYMLEIGAYLQSQGHQVSYFGMRDERNTVGNSLELETAAMDFRSRGLGRILYPSGSSTPRRPGGRFSASSGRFPRM